MLPLPTEETVRYRRVFLRSRSDWRSVRLCGFRLGFVKFHSISARIDVLPWPFQGHCACLAFVWLLYCLTTKVFRFLQSAYMLIFYCCGLYILYHSVRGRSYYDALDLCVSNSFVKINVHLRKFKALSQNALHYYFYLCFVSPTSRPSPASAVYIILFLMLFYKIRQRLSWRSAFLYKIRYEKSCIGSD